jgi:hypothetical protein
VAELMLAEPAGGESDVADDPQRLAALLGVTEGPGMMLLLGAFDGIAARLAELVPDVEIIVAHSVVASGPEVVGVSRLRIGDVVPLRNRGMRGVAVANGSVNALVHEAARVCSLAARVVVTNISDEMRAALPQLGLHVLAEQGDTLVAVRHG